ncbi:NUDIX hydrolase [archaeon]|jgi:8-oxo-dGTP pyrophosphatase MutT (NUDIX family)|nr:NUDIX hydrolase [archaeon]
MKVIMKERVCSTPYVNLDKALVETKSNNFIEHFILDYNNNSVAAVVVKDGKLLMLKTNRFICGKVGWEIPGGWMLDGETPLEAIRRKVEDETGYEVSEIKRLGISVPLIGISKKEHLFFFVEVGDKLQKYNNDLVCGLEFFNYNKVIKMVSRGLVFDEATLSGLMLAKADGYV